MARAAMCDGFHGPQVADTELANTSEQLRTLSQGPVAQREMPFLQALPAPVDASKQSVAMCQSEADAIAASLRHRLAGYSQSWVAKALGYSRSYFSELKTGTKAMPESRVAHFCHLTGTNLLQQYRDLQKAIALMQGESAAARIERIARAIAKASG